ncbi:MAG TPA: HAD-IA family hydrolase [Anaerohalosphaeraceae bacterium]|nr:HAD-IA family hydrolase [Anaerohalosphaeraceae bacterium]
MTQQPQSKLPAGVIFDMDGVLVDSEPFICKAACMMFDELGLRVRPEDFVPFVGMGENRYLGGVAEHYHFQIDITQAKKRTYDIYLDIIRGRLQPLPGVHAFVEKCRLLGKKIAIASSADRRKVIGNLSEIHLPPDQFDAVITGEDVVHKKPNPEIFLLAASKLGLAPQHCLVVEDAVSGVAAAKAAGAVCLALTTSFARRQLQNADFFAPSLAEVPDDVINGANP